MTWDEHEVSALRALWNEGKSASEIAVVLGGDATRNSVMGKLFRLGLLGARRRDADLWRGLSYVARREPSPPRTFSWEAAA